MKINTFLSLVVAAVLFTGCGDKTKEAAAEGTAATAEAVKQDTANAVEAAKIKAAEATEAVKEKAAEVTEATKDAVAAAMPDEPATPVSPAAYAKCQGCHGADGKTKALGKSAIIAGQDKATIIASMNAYKAGTRNVAGMGMLMKGQAASMSDADIEAVAEYLSAIK